MARAAAEFAADYYDALMGGRLPVMSLARPGFLRGAVPAAAPEQGSSFEAVLHDVKQVFMGRAALAGWLPRP